MQYEYVGAIEVTYGNALAGGGGFHRVTLLDGGAAELTQQTFLWFKLLTTSRRGSVSTLPEADDKASATAPTASATATATGDHRAIVDLRVCTEAEAAQLVADSQGRWVKMDKAVDRQRALYVCYETEDPRACEPAASNGEGKRLPLKEIRAIRDPAALPAELELVDSPLERQQGSEVVRSYLCFKRLHRDELTGKHWSIESQKAGNWIEVRDSSSNKWSVAQIVAKTNTELRVNVTTWRKGREEYMSRSACRQRVAKLGTHTNLHMSPSYPFTRKQGGTWHVTMRDITEAREEFDRVFFDPAEREASASKKLVPFIEKSLLCAISPGEFAEDMNAFQQHVLKNVVATMLSSNAIDEAFDLQLLALLRIILNGHASSMHFYAKHGGSKSAAKTQKQVYTAYLSSPEVLGNVPSRHPCRSMYYIDNLEVFLQAGGFRLLLQRMALRDVSLTEVALFCMLLQQAKPSLVEQKRRRSASGRGRSASSVDVQVEDFFREFMNAVFARLRRMHGAELKDDDGVIDHIVGTLDLIYRDGIFLGDTDVQDTSDANGRRESSDSLFAETFEVFHLDLSKKFICCPYLQQRMLGLSRINELITMATRKDTLQKKSSLSLKRAGSTVTAASVASSASESSNLPVTKWLRTKYIVEWLAVSDILEVILGDRERCAKYGVHEGVHLELLKRSKGIFEFVASNSLLKQEHIVLLWKTALNQLRTGRKTVLDLLLGLCHMLTADLMDMLLVLMTQVPIPEYDDLLVDFIKRVVVIASKQVLEVDGVQKKTLSSLVGSGSRNKISTSASQKDVEVFSKVIELGCTLLWNGILESAGQMPDSAASTSTVFSPALRSEMENALAESLNHIQQLATSSSSPNATREQQYLDEYMKKCAVNIKSGVMVEISMSLIKRIADGYGASSNAPASSSSSAVTRASFITNTAVATTPAELLGELNDNYSIMTSAVEELKTYMKQAKEKGVNDVPVPPSNSRERFAPSSHRVAMETRLSFFGYLTSKSNVELSFSLIEEVWTCFNGPGSTIEESNVFFRWLTSVIPDPNDFVQRAYNINSSFSASTLQQIFRCLVDSTSVTSRSSIRMDIDRMGKDGFWALERLFRFVNASERRLLCSATATAAESREHAQLAELFQVESHHLKGIDKLYDVALRATNDGVSHEASNYLVYLHLHVGTKLVRREVWIDFVTGCMQRLKEMKKTIAEDGRAVHRLLIMLATFLHQSIISGRDSANQGGDILEDLIVYVRTQDGRAAAPFRYQMRRTSLVSELRSRIAKDTGHPAERVRVVNEFKTKLTAQGHDRFTLEKARVFSTVPAASRSLQKHKHSVEAVLLSKVESDTVGHVDRTLLDFGSSRGSAPLSSGGNVGIESDWQACKLEISTDEHLSLLFELMAHGEGISEEVWKVLKLLPPDAELEKRIRTLDNTLAIDGSIKNEPSHFKLDDLLDSKCPPRLLYHLELVERFALCSGTFSDETASGDSDGQGDTGVGEVNEWSTSFIKLGGYTHLQNFVLSGNPRQLTAQGTLAVMCVSKVLKLLRHFVVVESKLSQTKKMSYEAMIHQAMDTLQSVQALHEIEMRASFGKKLVTAPLTDESSPLPITSYVRPEIEDPDNLSDIPFEAYLMTRALAFVSSSLLAADKDSLTILQGHQNYREILLHCLVNSTFKQVRQEAANVFAGLSTAANKNVKDRSSCCRHMLDILSSFDGPVSDEDYFTVYTSLITSAENLDNFDFLKACGILCRRVKAFEISEDSGARRNAPGTPSRSGSGSERQAIAGSPPVDALLEALLSTLLAVLKRIPDTLADQMGKEFSQRSLREFITLKLHEEEGIVDEIFNRCLFACSDSATVCPVESAHLYLQQPKCRSDSCREVAFSLLSELCSENTSGLQFLFVEMSKQHSLTPSPDLTAVGTTGSAPPMSKKKRSKSKDHSASNHLLQRGKYVGLKNLGCTCYMNSALQAFFMMPRFRRQILRVNGLGDHSQPLVYQLQSLFAHLEGSAKPYYNPKAFTAALKSWEGEAIDINVQQDASEFLTSFFQQIESEMNGFSGDSIPLGGEQILNTFFGGVFSNELVAEGDRYSERLEPFHFISVPVRDRKTLKESLDGWVEGDKVSYTWENSNDSGEKEKVTLDTHKRISIQKLPEYLVIHLKRFEFDFEAMQQTKLHDRFEFPMNLDMYPYTKEGQQEKRKRATSTLTEDPVNSSFSGTGQIRSMAPEYFNYELVGSVVHMGTAHSGHYYSFLREQDSAGEPQWYEFNDTVVSPFDPKNIPDECFGGEDERRKSGSMQASSFAPTSQSRMKNRSSFMLIYSRVRPQLRLEKGHHQIRSVAAAAIVVSFCVRVRRKASARLDYIRNNARVVAPENISHIIAVENRLFWRKKYLYDARCLAFTFEIVKMCLVGIEESNMLVLPRFEPIEVRLDALKLATKFVFGTLWQGGDVSKVLEWRFALRALYHDEIEGCRWLLATMQENQELLLDFLVVNENPEVRELMAIVLTEAIATTSNAECAEENTRTSTTQMFGRERASSKLPASFEFIFLLIKLMPSLLTVPEEQHHQYFALVLEFIQTGRNECVFLVVNNVIGAIVALMAGLVSTQPLLQSEWKRTKPKHILKGIEMSVTVLRLLSLLLRCSDPPAVDVSTPFLSPDMAQDHVHLPDSDRDVVTNERFILLLIQRANRYTKETKPLEQIVMHLCWESRRITAIFLEKIIQGITNEDHNDVKPYFRTLSTLFKLRDSLVSERLNEGMAKLLEAMGTQQRYYKATEISIDMVTRLAKRHSNVTRWLKENAATCSWMEKWLVVHVGPDGYLQQGKTTLVKPNSTSPWVNMDVKSPALMRSIDRTVVRLVHRIRGIFDPQGQMEPFYDSDDNPSRLVGKRVRVKWAKDKWYEGTVERYKEDTFEHFVVYDDGDKRNYRMEEKIFYVVESTAPRK
ncbi:TPA: hypothetical protein N0F65_007621 [Lagenidium giganteum]|uniref:ubiquitinyl hydrolase 1 n=1 Tax=Lagenidium giganteum TaxID=4803 RepID=A0AAV2Z7A5_9STRA|nr:TPA: hypothetical protein N0F65_007621 [Lagenidium giganteum]